MLTDRVNILSESITIAISTLAQELKAQGKNILSFSAGEPDFDTPQVIKDAAIKAINDGFTKYTAVDGIPELKAAIALKLKRDNGLDTNRTKSSPTTVRNTRFTTSLPVRYKRVMK
jgi:aspartate aminotransferase